MSEAKRSCCKIVFGAGHGLLGAKCSRPVKISSGGKFYCSIHSPEYLAKKEREKQDALAKEIEMKNAAYERLAAIREFKNSCVRAIREIAAGHNDAQSLAQFVLESEPKP